jgi:hypothetical protein
MIEQAVGRPLFKNLPLIKETDTIRKLTSETHLMGDHQRGRIVLVGKLADHIRDLAHRLRIGS